MLKWKLSATRRTYLLSIGIVPFYSLFYSHERSELTPSTTPPLYKYYWSQLLAIIGNYCFSQPQKEAQEPQKAFSIFFFQ